MCFCLPLAWPGPSAILGLGVRPPWCSPSCFLVYLVLWILLAHSLSLEWVQLPGQDLLLRLDFLDGACLYESPPISVGTVNPHWPRSHPVLHLILDCQSVSHPRSMSSFYVLIHPSLVFLAAFWSLVLYKGYKYLFWLPISIVRKLDTPGRNNIDMIIVCPSLHLVFYSSLQKRVIFLVGWREADNRWATLIQERARIWRVDLAFLWGSLVCLSLSPKSAPCSLQRAGYMSDVQTQFLSPHARSPWRKLDRSRALVLG